MTPMQKMQKEIHDLKNEVSGLANELKQHKQDFNDACEAWDEYETQNIILSEAVGDLKEEIGELKEEVSTL